MSAPPLLFSVNAQNDAASVGQAISSATLSAGGFVNAAATCVGIAGLPTVASDAFGSPFYSFSASDGQYMLMPDLSSTWAFDQGGFTAIGVVNFPDSQSAGGALFEFGFTVDPNAGTFGTDMISLTRSGTDGLGNAARIQISDGSGGPSVLGIPDLANLFAAATSASGSPHLIAVRVSNDASQGGHARVDYYADGFKIGTTVADGPFAALPPTPVATVGGWPASGTEFCDVGVYQLDVYNGAMSDADLSAAFAAMQAAWAASLSSPAPTATGTLTATVAYSADGSSQSYALSNYFSDPRGSLLTYFVASDPFPSGSGVASLSPDGQSLVLAWAGLAASDTSGALVVAASNASQGVATSFAVTVAAVQPPATTGIGSNVQYSTAYGAAPIDVALPTLFSDPQGETLTYHLSDDGAAPGVATLSPDGQDVVVAWRYLGVPDDVQTGLVVSASNQFAGIRRTIGVLVSGVRPPATSAGPAPTASVSSASPSTAVALSSCFQDPQGEPLTYYLASNPFGGSNVATLSQDGQSLDVAWQALGPSASTSNVVVAASNLFSGACSAVAVTVAGVAAPSVVRNGVPATSVSFANGGATIDLSQYFSDAQGEPLTYYLTANPFGPSVVSLLGPSGLGVTWRALGPSASTNNVVVAASNLFSGTAQSFAVTLAAAMPPSASPIASVAVSPTQSASVQLSSYFSDPQGGSLTFYLVSDPLGATVVTRGTGALTATWAPLASSNATVSIGVAASNLALNLGAAGAVPVSVAAVLPPVEAANGRALSNAGLSGLSNVAASYDLSAAFSDPQFLPLTYAIPAGSNPRGSASIAGHVLTVSPNFRNATYAVGVVATDSFGLAASDALTVTEGAAPAPTVAGGVPRSVTLSNSTAAFGLSNFFSDPLGCNQNLAYSVAQTAYNNATVVGDVLYVAGGWIGATPATYPVVVVASNAAYGVATTQTVLQATEAATQAPHAGVSTLASIAGLVLSNAQVADFALSNYFVDPQGSALSYWVASNAKPGSAVVLGNSNLHLVGAFRAASNYAVTVAASNVYGQYFAETLTVTEPTPLAPVQTPAVAVHAFPPPSGGTLTGPTTAVAGQAYGNGAYVVTQSDYLPGTSPAYASVCGAAATGAAAYRFTPALTSLGAVTASNGQAFSIAGLSNLFFPKDPTYGAAGPLQYYLSSNGSGFPGSATVAGNALTTRPFFSGKTYGVTAAATNAECLVTNTLTVTELAPAAIGLATVSNATPVRFGLSNSVADYGGQPTYYWLTANPNGNASIAAGGVLGVTGFYRGATYAVTVAASNSAGQVSAPTTLTVTEPAAVAPAVAATFATMTLTNNSSNVALANSFSDAQGSALYYWLSGNPKGNATLAGSTLSVSGFYRGATYPVSVSASNVYGKTGTGALTVTEPAAGAPTVSASTFAAISLTNNTSNVALSPFFSDPQGSALYYWVSANPQLDATISAGTLSVAGAYRGGAAYNVGVSASNVYGLSVAGSVAVTEANPVPALSGVTLPMTAIGTNTATFATAAAFTVTAAVTFSVTANPYSNATVNAATGALSVVGNNRGVGPYVVTVAATNASGSASISVTIVEPPVSTGLLALYMGESWNTGGVAGWRDLFGTNHATATTGTVAQTAGSLNGRTVLSGAASPVASIMFPSAVLPSTYTLFSLSRYTGTANQGRIVASTNAANWLTGHWSGLTGVGFHGAWVTPQYDAGLGTGWVLSSDQNGLYRYNGNTRSTGLSAGTPSYANIGVNVYNGNYTDWACACVVVFTGTLTAPQIQAVEAWLSSMYALTVTVSPSFVTPSSLTCAFSMRRYVGGYAGAIVNVRRGYDSATSDFYTDSAQTGGELWTGPAVGQGTSLTAWLSGSAASVVKWYDQSGNANHAYNYQTFPTTQYQTPKTQYQFYSGGSTVASSQPTLVRHCGYWTMRFRMACSSALFLTANINPNTVVAQLNNVNAGTLVAATGGLDQRMYGSAILAGNNGDWYACAGGTKLASFNGATLSANPSVNAWWSSIVLSSSAPATTAGTPAIATSFNRIGSDGYWPSVRGLDGYLSEICFHNTPLNAADASAIYAERFAPFVPATFPPGAMTAAQTTFAASSGQGASWSTDGGIYAASASSYYSYSGDPGNYGAYVAFAPGTAASGTVYGWTEAVNNYTGTACAYAGSVATSALTGGWFGNGCTLGGWVGAPAGATSYAGEWLQLKCPQTAFLTAYSITPCTGHTDRAPAAFALLGSANGGITWIALDVRTGVTGWVGGQAATFAPNQAVNHACSTFRLVVQQTNGNPWVSVYALQLQGYPQSGSDGVVCGGQTLWLDATNSTGATYTNASPIYSYDMSGNGNSFNLYNLSYTPVSAAPYASYYNWEQGSAQALRWPTGSSSYNVPFAAGVNTLVAVMKWSAGTGDYRSLCHGIPLNHQVITNIGTQSLGMYNDTVPGFVACDTPVLLGTTAGTTTAFTTFNLVAWKLSTTAPYYRFYMNPASTATALTPIGQIATNANAALTSGIGYIGGPNGSQCVGDVAEFFWFPRELSDAELVQLFYYYQPIYSLGVPTMLGSAAGCCGLYSLKALTAAANGAIPVVNVRRSSDGATTDAYNVGGVLCTSAGGATTLATWLSTGASTGYVATWYDQSGSANHATMSSASQQPTIDVANLRVVFAGAQYLSMPNGTVPSGNAQYTITAKHGPINASGAYGIWGSGSSLTDGTLALDVENGRYNNYWYGDDILGTNGTASSSTDNVVTCRYDQSTRYMYIKNALVSTKANVSARNSSSANNTLGVTQNYGYWLNSYLDYVAIFSYSMSDSNRLAVENL